MSPRFCLTLSRTVIAALAALAVCAPRSAAAQLKPDASIVRLGALDTVSASSSVPTASHGAAINDHGVVAGHSFVRSGDALVKTAAVWHSRSTPGIALALPHPSLPGGTANSGALAINNKGQAAGWAMVGGTRHAVLWTPQPDGTYTATDLGTLGGPDSVALGINDAGKVVGWAHVVETGYRTFGDGCAPNGQVTQPCHYRHAFAWSSTAGMQDLGVPQPQFASPWHESRAKGINNQDQIVGDNANEMAPFGAVWIAGRGYTGYIGTPNAVADAPEPNGVYALVQELWNVLGRTAGWTWYWGSSLTPNVPGLALHSKGLKVTTAPAFTNAAAFGINEAGMVVGTGTAPDGQAHAFLRHGGWNADLNLEPFVAGSGWTLNTATDVNNADEIVGSGIAGQLAACADAASCPAPVQGFVIRSPNGACRYALSATTIQVGPRGASVPITVTTDPVCRWIPVDIPRVPSWLGTPEIPADGFFGSRTITFEIAPDDPSEFAKVTQHEIAGHLVRFSRLSFPSATFSPASAKVGSSSGTGVTSLFVPYGYDWQASASASWLRLASPVSGAGGLWVKLEFTFESNPSTRSRTAWISVAVDGRTWTFMVTQDGAPAATIAGSVSSNGVPLANVPVVAYSSTGSFAAVGFSRADGSFSVTAAGGSYRLRTFASAGLYIDEAWKDIACVPSCTSTTGDLVIAATGQTTAGIDFDLRRRDAQPPIIHSVTPSVSSLGPPNHKMMPVTISIVASDDSKLAPACQVIGVASNEAVDGTGDGNTAPDWQIVSSTQILLRAERSGQGSGRIYTVTVECRDAANNKSTATTAVTVLHDQGK